jgi:hypothetical protein
VQQLNALAPEFKFNIRDIRLQRRPAGRISLDFSPFKWEIHPKATVFLNLSTEYLD